MSEHRESGVRRVTLEDVRPFFVYPLAVAAQKLDMSVTSLKVCVFVAHARCGDDATAH